MSHALEGSGVRSTARESTKQGHCVDKTYGPAESCHHRGFIGFQENGINPYIWCVVGGLLGGLAGVLFKSGERSAVIENVLVGVFGAYIGGDFVAALLSGGKTNDSDFSVGSLGLAIAGAFVALVLLRLMRRVVGNQHVTKGPRRRD